MLKILLKKKNERENSCDEIMLPNLIKFTGLFKKRLSDTHGTKFKKSK